MKNAMLTVVISSGIATAAAGVVAAQSIPDFDRAAAEAYCTEEWTKRGVFDKNMFDYCMNGQVDGYENATAHVVKYAEVPFLKEIIIAAEEKWLKPHKYQYEMLAYVIEKEGEAYLDVTYDVQSGKYSQESFSACSDKWLKRSEPEWTMVSHCLERGQ